MTTGSTIASDRHRLDRNGAVFEFHAVRAGLRTEIVLYRDGRRIAEGSGIGRVLVPVPSDGEPEPGAENRQPPASLVSDDAGTSDGAESGAETAGEASGGAVSGASGGAGATGEASGGVPGGGGRPTVLAVAAVPGRVVRAFLLVPRDTPAEDEGERRGEGLEELRDELPEGMAELVGFAAGERHPFEPPPGTFAARLLTFQREHPRLYASRHVALATGKVLFGLLGVTVFFSLFLSRLVQWIVARLRGVNWPDVRLPDVDPPSLPIPGIPLPDLPEVALPGWVQAVLATAKYWVPILIAVGAAVQEVRKRRRRAEPSAPMAEEVAGTGQDGTSTRPGGDRRPDAHR